jgi:hypothetical protein
MAFAAANRVLETTTTTGTGTLNLGGAVSGYQTFVAGVGSDTFVVYTIWDPATGDWEVGQGTTLDATPDQLTREVVIESSNSDNLVSLAAGTKRVFLVKDATTDYLPGNMTEACLLLVGEDGVITQDNTDFVKFPCHGRLTTESGVPVSTSDRTSQSTLYFTPYKGNNISFYQTLLIPTKFRSYWFEEFAIALSGLTSGKPYDVFAFTTTATPSSTNTSTDVLTFGSAQGWATGSLVVPVEYVGDLTDECYFYRAASSTTGTLHTTLAGAFANTNKKDLTLSVTTGLYGISLELSAAWTSDTVRSESLAFNRAICVKSGADTRRYLGTIYTTSTTATEDSAANRYVWNYYNQVRRTISQVATGSSAAYTTATTYRAAGGNNNVRCNVVAGLDGHVINLDAYSSWVCGSVQAARLAIALDSTTTPDASFLTYLSHNNGVLTTFVPQTTFGKAYVPLGRHFYQLVERQDTTTSTTHSNGQLRGEWIC